MRELAALRADGGFFGDRCHNFTSWDERMPDLTEADRRRLAGLSPHAFRHTFGTQSVATDVPLDVVQQLLGHASLQTTSVYVTAEEKRRRAEIAKYHARLVDPK